MRVVADEEKKKGEEAKFEAVEVIGRCTLAVKRLGDIQEAAEAREDGLNKIIHDLEAKAKASLENKLQMKSTISELRKGEGIDWEMAIEVDDFAPICETLFNLAIRKVTTLVGFNDELKQTLEEISFPVFAEGLNIASNFRSSTLLQLTT